MTCPGATRPKNPLIYGLIYVRLRAGLKALKTGIARMCSLLFPTRIPKRLSCGRHMNDALCGETARRVVRQLVRRTRIMRLIFAGQVHSWADKAGRFAWTFDAMLAEGRTAELGLNWTLRASCPHLAMAGVRGRGS